MGNNTAQILTAIASIVTALGLLVISVTTLVPILRKVKQVEVHVNQQQTDLRNYQAALVRSLKLGGIEVPVDQSKPSAEVYENETRN